MSKRLLLSTVLIVGVLVVCRISTVSLAEKPTNGPAVAKTPKGDSGRFLGLEPGENLNATVVSNKSSNVSSPGAPASSQYMPAYPATSPYAPTPVPGAVYSTPVYSYPYLTPSFQPDSLGATADCYGRAISEALAAQALTKEECLALENEFKAFVAVRKARLDILRGLRLLEKTANDEATKDTQEGKEAKRLLEVMPKRERLNLENFPSAR